jgi:hypothetical protein
MSVNMASLVESTVTSSRRTASFSESVEEISPTLEVMMVSRHPLLLWQAFRNPGSKIPDGGFFRAVAFGNDN